MNEYCASNCWGYDDLEPVMKNISDQEQKEREQQQKKRACDEKMIENARLNLQEKSKEEIIDNYCNLVRVLFSLINAHEEMSEELESKENLS